MLRSDWLTQGPSVEEFEKGICQVAGAAHAVVCNSGTAALHLAAVAAGLTEGLAAIVPAITFVATANAVRMTGAEVVFADVDPQTGRMNAATLEAAFARSDRGNRKIRAVFPVHLGGEPSSVADVHEVSAGREALVVEDACHAFGGSYRDGGGSAIPVGACRHSAMACFSFHPVKPVTTAEGGAVTTNDAAFDARMRRVRSHGITREPELLQNRTEGFGADGEANPWYYEMLELGWNYRISDIQCALGLSQLVRLTDFRTHRDGLARRYRQLLAPFAPSVVAMPTAAGTESGHHLFVVLIDFAALGLTRAHVMQELQRRGVGSQVHYIPVPWQPYYTDRYGKGDYPGAASYYSKCLSLPLFATMDEADVGTVVETLASVLKLA